MKRILVGLAAAVMLLAGCSQNALLVTESVKQSFDVTSNESKSTIVFSGNYPTDQLDEQSKVLLGVLNKGIVLEAQNKNEEEGRMTLSAKDPSSVTGTTLWPTQTAPVIDLFVKGNDMLIKSSIDQKFLSVPAGQTPTADQKAVTGTIRQLLKDYISQYNYTMKNAETVGQEQVTLPTGQVNTTHVRITLDMQEALNMAVFTLDNLSKFEQLNNIQSLLSIPADQNVDVAKMRSDLSDMAEQLKAIKAEDLKAQGFDGNLSLDFWINGEKQMVQSDLDLALTLPGSDIPGNVDAKPVNLSLKVSTQNWNQNQPVNIEFPAAAQIITEQQLKDNRQLVNSFAKKSPIRVLAESLLPFIPPFADVADGYWASNQIQTLKEQGKVSGYENNEFRPETSITRAEFIKMAVSSLGLESKSSNLTFMDNSQIPGWANGYVQTAVQAGLVSGYEDNTIRPNQAISRAEMVKILVKGMNLTMNEQFQTTYKDTNSIPDWARVYVQTSTANGLVHGREDGRFAPNEHAKRAEVATVLYNWLMKDTVQN